MNDQEIKAGLKLEKRGLDLNASKIKLESSHCLKCGRIVNSDRQHFCCEECKSTFVENHR